MESVENIIENGNCEKIDENYESKKGNFLFDYDHMDNKSYEFDANFNGNGDCIDDEEHMCHEDDR